MSYFDICILGWNLNALMFVVNLLLAVKTLKSSDPESLQEQSTVLNELHSEFEKYYPNRKIETIISYLIPFTAFLRVTFRLFEMFAFFLKIEVQQCSILWFINTQQIFKKQKIETKIKTVRVAQG